jgi:small-conductance mechanosensitive channel
MKKLLRRRQFTGLILFPAVAAACILPLAAAAAETSERQPAAVDKVAEPASAGPIPIAEIAVRAGEALHFLHSLDAQLLLSPAVEAIRTQLPIVKRHVEEHYARTTEILQRQAPLATLQAQQQIWQGIKLQINGWLKVLTERAIHIRNALSRLVALQDTWSKTSDAAKTAEASAVIVQQVETVRAAISAVQPLLRSQQNDVLDLQSRVGTELDRCESALTQLDQAQKQAVGGILVRDGLPLWTPDVWMQARATALAEVRNTVADRLEDARRYVLEPALGLPWHAGLILALTLLASAARRRMHAWKAAGRGIPGAAAVFDRPYSAALLITALLATSPFSPAPRTVQYPFTLAALLPMIRLVQPVAGARVVRRLYAVALLFAIDIVRVAHDGVRLIEQVLLVVETAAGVLLIVRALTIGDLRRARRAVEEMTRLKLLRITAVLVLLALLAALATATCGYMRVARLLAAEIFAGSALALASYAFLQVANGLVALALRVWPLRLLHLVERHRGLVEQRAQRVLVFVAVAGWFMRTLSQLGLLRPALDLAQAVLAVNLERGAINVSVGDVLTFALTVWVAYLLSAFLRFLLKEDVYPRIRIAPGLSYAVSSLLNYLILALGVVMGMGLMGIDLSRVAILAGAFGVGIGFGLQSVVNNFVCGLVLLFERPIHVGDMVEVGDLLGEVRRIGIRASTIRTRHGADIVVPNALLVTDRVTNWTLSDPLRRIHLPLGVNYGASPRKVIEVLERVARATPRVLQDPAPSALMTGYGDSSINFELRAWTNESMHWQRVRSELAVAVYDAVQQAGMSFPFPQREVRLLHATDDATVPNPPASTEEGRQG